MCLNPAAKTACILHTVNAAAIRGRKMEGKEEAEGEGGRRGRSREGGIEKEDRVLVYEMASKAGGW